MPPSAVTIGAKNGEALNIGVDATSDTKLKLRKARTSIYFAGAEVEEKVITDVLPEMQEMAQERWGAHGCSFQRESFGFKVVQNLLSIVSVCTNSKISSS